MLKAKKQTSDRVSRIAGRVLRAMGELKRIDDLGIDMNDWITPRELKALCASALSQDETKGVRVVKRRKGVKR